jgi:NADH dehydrogenase (ubiquinone) Fe-S protein 5
MSSGYGIFSQNGRCYGFWMDYKQCLVHSDESYKCVPFKDDYVECLHRIKEVKKIN